MSRNATTAPTAREKLGFRDGDKGTHSSRTLMLAELTKLLAATPRDATMPEFRRAVVDENVLGKRTAMTREHTIRKLKALYGLDSSLAVYRIMRRLWDEDPDARPLLALMCGVARDPLLRGSVALVLETPVSQVLTSQALASTVRTSFSESTRQATVSHLASTWHVAGYLSDATARTRARARATPGAAAYALALGFMEGGRGSLLLTTPWARLLDCPPDEALAWVRQAAQRGWVEYRAAGDVLDLRVEALFTDEERAWCDGQ